MLRKHQSVSTTATATVLRPFTSSCWLGEKELSESWHRAVQVAGGGGKNRTIHLRRQESLICHQDRNWRLDSLPVELMVVSQLSRWLLLLFAQQ